MVFGYKASKYRIRALNSGVGKHNTAANLFVAAWDVFDPLSTWDQKTCFAEKRKDKKGQLPNPARRRKEIHSENLWVLLYCSTINFGLNRVNLSATTTILEQEAIERATPRKVQKGDRIRPIDREISWIGIFGAVCIQQFCEGKNVNGTIFEAT